MEECYFCGEEENLEEHHILPVRKVSQTSDWKLLQEAESQDNKVTLCHSCHVKIEKLYDETFWKLVREFINNSKKHSKEKVAEELKKIDKEYGL